MCNLIAQGFCGKCKQQTFIAYTVSLLHCLLFKWTCSFLSLSLCSFRWEQNVPIRPRVHLRWKRHLDTVEWVFWCALLKELKREKNKNNMSSVTHPQLLTFLHLWNMIKRRWIWRFFQQFLPIWKQNIIGIQNIIIILCSTENQVNYFHVWEGKLWFNYTKWSPKVWNLWKWKCLFILV